MSDICKTYESLKNKIEKFPIIEALDWSKPFVGMLICPKQ